MRQSQSGIGSFLVPDYVIASAGEDPRITMWTSQGQRLGAIPEGGLENPEVWMPLRPSTLPRKKDTYSAVGLSGRVNILS